MLVRERKPTKPYDKTKSRRQTQVLAQFLDLQPLDDKNWAGPFTKHGSGSFRHSRIKAGSGRLLGTGPGLSVTRKIKAGSGRFKFW